MLHPTLPETPQVQILAACRHMPHHSRLFLFLFLPVPVPVFDSDGTAQDGWTGVVPEFDFGCHYNKSLPSSATFLCIGIPRRIPSSWLFPNPQYVIEIIQCSIDNRYIKDYE